VGKPWFESAQHQLSSSTFSEIAPLEQLVRAFCGQNVLPVTLPTLQLKKAVTPTSENYLSSSFCDLSPNFHGKGHCSYYVGSPTMVPY